MRKGTKMKRVKKYYDYEYDRIITEDTAKRQWQNMNEWCRNHGIKEKGFEEYAKENFFDLSDRIERAAAQAAHDKCGWFEPVCTWETLLRKAK